MPHIDPCLSMSSAALDIACRKVLVSPFAPSFQGNPKFLSFSASIPVGFPSSAFIKSKNSSGIPDSDVAKQYKRRIGMGNTHRRAGVAHAASEDKTSTKVQVSDDEWRKKLSPEQFRIARKKGTEMAFSGQYWNEKRAGSYHCICCDTPLFSSETKFDSGTGWPSYWDKIANVAEHKDWSIPFMPRVEVVCDVCDAHLGHVFNDGPRPTGLRYCINSASLKFVPKN